MSDLGVLHQIRQKKGCLLQARCCAELRQLGHIIRRGELDHPFRLYEDGGRTKETSKRIMRSSSFSPGAKGSSALPSEEYVYHLSSIEKILTYIKDGDQRTWTHFPGEFQSLDHDPTDLFDLLVRVYESEGDWLYLGNYAKGRLSGYRDFTWWTTLELVAQGIVCRAHQIGLPNKWIPPYAVILRCRSDYVVRNNLAFVPTTMDGFTSEIFSPADYRDAVAPGCGRTVNLDSIGPLCQGAEEYALKPISVSEIEFYPVEIDRRKRIAHKVVNDKRLWQLLECYYRRL